MKIKDIITEAFGAGFFDQMKRAIKNAPSPSGLRTVNYRPKKDFKVKADIQRRKQDRNVAKQPAQATTQPQPQPQPQQAPSQDKATPAPAATKSTPAQPKQVTPTPAPTAPKDNPNASIKSKVDYLVKQGVLQSGRITDDEKQYIDSVDVYVDINKFNNVDPSRPLIKSTPPHHHLTISSVQIPMKDWQEAIGRSGEGLSGYVGFDLTPAGWWSDDFKAYVNPNSNLSDLVDRYQKG